MANQATATPAAPATPAPTQPAVDPILMMLLGSQPSGSIVDWAADGASSVFRGATKVAAKSLSGLDITWNSSSQVGRLEAAFAAREDLAKACKRYNVDLNSLAAAMAAASASST